MKRFLGFWRGSLSRQFALIAFLFGVPLAVATGLLSQSLEKNIDLAKLEIGGLVHHGSQRMLLEALHRHRDLAVSMATTGTRKEGVLSDSKARVEKAFEALRSLHPPGAEDAFGTRDQLDKLGALWSDIQGNNAASDPDDIGRAYTDLLNELSVMMDRTATASGLLLDPDPDTLLLLLVLSQQIPALAEHLGQVQNHGQIAIGTQEMTPAMREKITGAVAGVGALRTRLVALASRVFEVNPEAQAILSPKVEAMDEELGKFTIFARKHFVLAAAATASPEVFTERAEPALAAVFQMYDSSHQEVRNLLGARIERLLWQKWGILSFVLLFGCLSVLVAVRIVRGIVRGAAAAARTADDIANGDLHGIAASERPDEIGAMLRAMRRMQETLADFVEAQRTMAERHQAGVMSHVIAAERFQGIYRQMAAGSNELVSRQIAITRQVIDVLGHYARGDLKVDMPELPGEAASVTEAVRAAKARLIDTLTDVNALVEAASRGEFGLRGDAQRHEGVYREMVEGLNEVMRTADAGLQEVGRVLERLAEGDLTHAASGRFSGRLAVLQSDTNRTVGQLRALIGQVRESMESINTASKEIAAGNQHLSKRTEEQAASLVQTASSMAELTSTVKRTAGDARLAKDLVVSASEVALRGGDSVRRAVATMAAVSASSRKISDITSLIDGIASQTNILALNAAVEAARAGDHGRGFAVVASEVRNLAQKSSAASKEIRDLIADSAEKVASGLQLVNDAGQTMEEVVASVKRASGIMADIATASLEQSAGIDQVNQAVSQMDEVTQRNAALVQQAAAAALSLEEQAQSLAKAVVKFKVGERSSRAHRGAQPRGFEPIRSPDRQGVAWRPVVVG